MEDLHGRQLFKHLKTQLCDVRAGRIENGGKRVAIVDKCESKSPKYNRLWLDHLTKTKSAESGDVLHRLAFDEEDWGCSKRDGIFVHTGAYPRYLAEVKTRTQEDPAAHTPKF